MDHPEIPDGLTGTVAVASFLLGTPRREWVHRRVETVEILGEGSLRRRVSLDLTVPSLPPAVAPEAAAVAYVPIAFLAKGAKLEGFDLRDADGAALPLMTIGQSSEITGQIVSELARLRPVGADIEFGLEILKSLVPDEKTRADSLIKRRKAAAAEGDDDEVERADVEALTWLDEEVRSHPERFPEDPLGERHRNWIGLHPLARDLHDNAVLYARIDARPGSRRVVKYCYDEPLRPKSLPWRGLVGLSDVQFEVPAVGIGDAREYHMQIAAPAELLITSSRLVDADGEQLDVDANAAESTHLLTADRPAGTSGKAHVAFSLRSRSLVGPALALSTILVAVLVLGSLFRDEFGTEVEAVTTLLVLVPGLAATYLASAGEHRLVHLLVRGLRLLLLLVALISFVATISLVVLKDERRERLWTWLALLATASGVAVIFALGFLRARRLERSSPGD